MLLFTRLYSSGKQESYFSAIGGDSDKPPPDLTPEQVNNHSFTSIDHAC